MSRVLKYSAVSDVGCVRTNNEDMAFVDGRIVRDSACAGETDSETPVAFAVADGMGGYEGGEVASEIVCRAFASFMKDFRPAVADEAVRMLKDWAVETNALVLETASLREELSEMGTTFVGLIFGHDSLILINIGDSRCYRLRHGILRQLTVDHSERERTGNPDVPSNLIYNFMGNVPMEFISDVKQLKPIAGDVYILCSDGLSDLVDDDAIEGAAPDVEALVEAARNAGGRDNITVVAVEYQSR